MALRLEAKRAATHDDDDIEMVESGCTSGSGSGSAATKRRRIPVVDMSVEEPACETGVGSKAAKTGPCEDMTVFVSPNASCGSSPFGSSYVKSFQTSYSVIYDDAGNVPLLFWRFGGCNMYSAL